jgi:glucose 1-dehydrogenase
MLKRKHKEGGVIVMVSSIHGARSVEYMSAYAASKAALDSLTRGLALEYAPDRIRVNGIAPGVVPVERTADAFANSEVVDMWRKHLPVDRVGSVEEVAEATLTLLTNAWITGTIHTIDGGMSCRMNMPNRPRPHPSEKRPVVSDQVQFESSKDSASTNV